MPRIAVTQDFNPSLSCTWKMLMKNDNDRTVSVPTSLRTNSLLPIFYKRQTRIITKRFTMDLLGLPVLLDNLRYYSKCTKLSYIHFLGKTNGKNNAQVYLISVQPPEFLTYVQHIGLVLKVILTVIS